MKPLIGGHFVGPAFNASVTDGTAYSTVVYNGTVQVPTLNIYGIIAGLLPKTETPSTSESLQLDPRQRTGKKRSSLVAR